MRYDRGSKRLSSTFTTRRGYYLNQLGSGSLLFSIIFVFFGEDADKYTIALFLFVAGILFLALARKFRHPKPDKTIEYDENGNIKPRKL